jgi:signal transduction histidine kinase
MEKEYQNGVVKKNPSISLNKLYITALSVVAILSIAGQILIQHALNSQSSDSYVVNVSGRQRMFSQRICKLSLLIDKENISTYNLELDTVVKVWKKFHYGLYRGDETLNLDGRNSNEIMFLFKNVDLYFLEIYKNAEVIVHSSSSVVNQNEVKLALKKILSNEGLYLNSMEKVVRQYEYEAREKVRMLKTIELILLILTLFVLFLEGYFIFKPASATIKTTMSELLNAKNELKRINEQLEARIKERTEQLYVKNLELESKNHELEKINKDLDTFVYTTSHDLKGPIINIEGLVKVLETEIPRNTSSNELVNLLHESINKFKTVLAELADTGKAKIDAKNGGVPLLFKDVLEEIKISIHELIISSNAEIEDDFSLAPSLNFSAKNLRSILYNLMSNSIKFRSTERSPYIKISTVVIGSYLLLKVSDNGIGIKQEDISKVFSIYQRLHKDIEGTGVGMSIIKSIVDNYGGKIEVESEVGKGTVFTVYFKL